VILLLLLLLLGLRRQRARRDAADVRGLYAIISRNAEQVAQLKAPGKRAETFRFVIRDEGEPTERLDYPKPEDTAYAARRGRVGQVRVRTPAGEDYEIDVGGHGEPLPSGLQLAFRDAKYAVPRSRSSANGARSSTNGSPARANGDTTIDPAPTPTGPGRGEPPAPPDDPWLT